MKSESVIENDEMPLINHKNYKRMIVKSPCLTVKSASPNNFSGKKLFACGTQLGKIFIGDANSEPTSSLDHLFYYQQRYYNTTVFLQNEKESPRIVIPLRKIF